MGLLDQDYMMPPPQMRFSPMQSPGLLQPPQQQQKPGMLTNAMQYGPSAMSFLGMGGTTGGANVGDVAHNWLGGMTNPSGDPFGLDSKNAAAGLLGPDLSGEQMTGLFGGGAPQLPQMQQMQAPPLPQQPQKQGDGGGLMKLAMLAMMA